MKRKSCNELNMVDSLLLFCDQQTGATAGLSAFAPLLGDTRNKRNVIHQYDQVTMTGTKGITAASKKDREQMIILAVKCRNSLVAFATANGDIALKSKVNFTKSQLIGMKKQEAADACQIISTEAIANLVGATPFGLIDLDVNNLQTLCSNYQLFLQNPRLAIVTRKEAGKQRDLLLAELIKVNLMGQMDPMVQTLRATNPSFVGGYESSRIISDLGRNITKMRGVVTDANGVALANVPIQIRNISGGAVYNTVTDNNGNFIILNIASGDYNATVTAVGYKPVTETGLHFAPGKEIGRNFMLSAA